MTSRGHSTPDRENHWDGGARRNYFFLKALLILRLIGMQYLTLLHLGIETAESARECWPGACRT